ncbi:MAG: hypothetical protein EOM53_03615 [Alphaproteobacteria bacterium]|nr:hypothetical protein [Alphaproteobacteria bacterium]NCB49746.1 hypothetical protein [Alphaproteobacteria bacterium]
MKKLFALTLIALAGCSTQTTLKMGESVPMQVYYAEEKPEECKEIGLFYGSCYGVQECTEDFKEAAKELNGNAIKIVNWNETAISGGVLFCPPKEVVKIVKKEIVEKKVVKDDKSEK